MDTTFTEQMRELLISQKREILEALAATNEEFRAIVAEMDPKDVADVASDDIDRKMIEAPVAGYQKTQGHRRGRLHASARGIWSLHGLRQENSPGKARRHSLCRALHRVPEERGEAEPLKTRPGFHKVN